MKYLFLALLLTGCYKPFGMEDSKNCAEQETKISIRYFPSNIIGKCYIDHLKGSSGDIYVSMIKLTNIENGGTEFVRDYFEKVCDVSNKNNCILYEFEGVNVDIEYFLEKLGKTKDRGFIELSKCPKTLKEYRLLLKEVNKKVGK